MKLIKPNDLGNNLIVEWSRKININDYVRQANKEIKKRLIQSSLDLSGIPIALSYTKTRFGGSRTWFMCPQCQSRVGTLFYLNNQVFCRVCGGIRYKNQRYKGMLEKEL